MREYKLHKGVAYFAKWADAAELLWVLGQRWVGVRLVRYELGTAVQYYKSGPYYPQLEETE